MLLERLLGPVLGRSRPGPASPTAAEVSTATADGAAPPGVVALHDQRLTPGAVAALATAYPSGELRALSLVGSRLGDAGARALAEVRFGALEVLVLSGNDLGDAGAAALARAPWLATVHTLVLAGNHIGPAGLRALLGSPHLRSLETLDLTANPVGDDGAAALADAAGLTSVRTLRLERARLTARSGWALSTARTLQPESLALKRNRLTGPALDALLAGRVARRLRVLGLAWNPVRDDGARALAASAPASLAALNLTRAGLTDEGARALAAAPRLVRLEHLELRGNRIGPAGQAALAGARDPQPDAGPPPVPAAG